jgi:hypothetical protein
MQPTVDKSKLMKKRIPTMVGLGVLVIGLIVGVIFLGTGPGVFAPRATPETTPSQIKLTNVTDSGFTVSFFTAESTPGFVKYGTEVDAVKSQTGDDRDQLSGTVGSYQLHHITVRGLKPSTSYYYLIGTGTNASFDNNGAPFTVKTTEKGGAPSAAKTAYGNILSAAGNPVNGAIVYVSLPEVGEMSSLTKASGGWAIPLSNARTADGSGYAIITETDVLTVLVQGLTANETSNVTVSVAESQPVADITLGQNKVAEKTLDASDSATADLLGSEATDSGSLEDTVAQFRDTLADSSQSAKTFELADNLGVTKVSGGLDSLGVLDSSSSSSVAEASEEANVVLDLQGINGQVLDTQTPLIAGKAAPNVVVSIEVHSDTQITQQLTADENGYFSLDIEALKKNLEPGEHTATYSYVDPATGQTVTKTVTFTVEPKTTASTGGTTQFTPYGSGNPYSLNSTNSGTATTSGTATNSANTTSTRSAVISTKSAIPVSGSVGTTMALVMGGIFFIMAGGWSYYLATQIDSKEI